MIKSSGLSLLVWIAMVAASLYFYPHLPASIPTKFDLSGHPIAYQSRLFVTLFMPCAFLAMIFFANWFVRVSPKKFSMPNSRKALDQTLFGSGLLFLGLHLGMLMSGGNNDAIMAQAFSIGGALFLVVVGNVLGKTERNFIMGIRVPWTLASQINWRATHRFGGKSMVVGGVFLLMISFFHPSFPLAVAVMVIPTFMPVIYSYVYYRKYERPLEAPTDRG